MTAVWFAGQVTPEQDAHGWLRNEDGTAATLWRPYLQCGEFVMSLSTTFRSREDCEKFIREEILMAAFDEAGAQ